MDLERVGRRIAEQRKFVRRVSQEKMAEELGMYQADISALEHARKGSGISDLNKLQTVADYLGISLRELLFGMDDRSRMAPYVRGKSQIRWAGEKEKLTARNRKMLSCFFEIPEEQVHPVIFKCGSYVLFALREDQSLLRSSGSSLGISRLHLLVLFENRIIAGLDAAHLPLFYLIHRPSFQLLQQMIDPMILDVTDILRTLNPYVPLMQFSPDPAEQEAYREKVYRRMEELMEVREQESLILAENLYVLEECRQRGICTMLLDAAVQILQTETLWLNLEPLEWDSFLAAEYGRMVPPFYHKSTMQTVSLNAGIAELLGFTADPEGWSRQMVCIEDPDHACLRDVTIRKTAYRLSGTLKQILRNDGDLVARGRALQVLAQTDENPASGEGCRFRYQLQEKGIVAELETSGEESILGLLDEAHEVKLTAAPRGTVDSQKGKVDLSRFHWLQRQELEDSSLEAYDLIEVLLLHLEQHEGTGHL